MKGLISHEESQEVTKAFRALGHEFYSNDLKPCSGGRPEWHIQKDCFIAFRDFDSTGRIEKNQLDFYGAHPDCTFLTNAGIRWLTSRKPRKGYEWNEKYQRYINPERWKCMEKATHHFWVCYTKLQEVGKGYIENPKMHPYAMEIIGIPPTQIIHPYYFGSPQMKETHLWIVGLPELIPDNMLTKPKKEENYEEWLAWQDCWMASPGPLRAEKRSKTDPNVARAFAEQWGRHTKCSCERPFGNPRFISNYCPVHNNPLAI